MDCGKRIGRRREFVGCDFYWWGQNPDLGVVLTRYTWRKPPERASLRPPDPPLRSGTPLLKLLCVFWLFVVSVVCGRHLPSGYGVGFGWCSLIVGWARSPPLHMAFYRSKSGSHSPSTIHHPPSTIGRVYRQRINASVHSTTAP